MKKVVLSIALSIAAFLGWISLGFAFFVVLFQLPVFGSVDILFYRGILIAILSSVILCVALRSLSRRKGSEILSLASLSFSLNLTFLIVLPVTIDRSVTVFLLNEIEQAPAHTLTAAELEEQLIARYVKEFGAVNRRMNEQIHTGHISQTTEGYTLTEQGRRFLEISRIVGKVFRVDPRFVETRATSESSQSPVQ